MPDAFCNSLIFTFVQFLFQPVCFSQILVMSYFHVPGRVYTLLSTGMHLLKYGFISLYTFFNTSLNIASGTYEANLW